MDTLIKSDDVLSLAYTADGRVTNLKITKVDIAAAEGQFLLPIIGEELYKSLMQGNYPTLLQEYVAPQVAAWTRYIVEPIMVERCGYESSAAYNEVRKVIYRRLRGIARNLSRQLSNYLNAHCDEFPEYNPADNSLNHCSIDGDVVQIF